MNPRLVGIAGPFQGVTFALPEGEINIGRDSSNQLWIADAALSRRQCAVVRQGTSFVIRDLGSRNGTVVNGVPIAEQELRHGDQISVGDSVLVFLTEESGGHHLEKSAVDLTDTAEVVYDGSLVLRQEDALYLHADQAAVLPPTERVVRDLNALLRIATGIGAIRNLDSLQWQLLGFVFDFVPAQRAAILLLDDLREFNSAVAWDRVRGPGTPVRVSRAVIRRVIDERAGIVIADAISDTVLSGSETLRQLGVSSVLCVPLLINGQTEGVIYLDTKDPSTTFDQHHLQVMAAIAGIVSLALDNVRHFEQLRQENQDLRAEINLEHDMVGASARMREVFDFIRRVAPTDSTVLIQGESGTGKELVARAIHRNSSRAEGPFVAINCAAIAETLLESELFGHEKGAFTGAVSQKKGKVEVAQGGTLFLDEITELAAGLQAKLLRVLQEREFERLGGTRPIPLDLRLVAASNRDLPQVVESGAFRKDLYYRINVVAVTMPALRDRREDIPVLAEHFVAKAARKSRGRVKPMAMETRACLMSYDWPGNVRELENAIERALVLGCSDVILPEDLPEAVLDAVQPAAPASARFQGTVRETKKQLILQALQQANGSYIEAAKALGMHPNSLLRLIRNLDLKGAVKAVASNPLRAS